uniref:Uncharacterized protein n=1 Tax=Dechloromonas aromatica (strain RCB) TaxID=159087 RepID=Q47GA7_DECAR
MAKRFKTRNRAKRPLDLAGIREGKFAVVGGMTMAASEFSSTSEAFQARFRQVTNDLRKTGPAGAAVSVVVDWPCEIRFRSIVTALPQGALVADGENDACFSPDSGIENSALAEAEEIAKAARQISQAAIDVGNGIASDAERRIIPLNEVTQIMASSPDEAVSRYTYGRARGQETEIHYPDGERIIGGDKPIPATAHSKETFALLQCNLREIKPGVLAMTSSVPHEGWRQLQGHTPGIELIKGEPDSTVLRSLLMAANARIPVDMTVCISEKVATGDRWCTPISIQNSREVFEQVHEWLTYLEENLSM